MPRNVSGVMSWPAGTTATTNTTISSADYNAFLADLLSDLNAARPIVAGGTGATTKQGAIDALFDGATHVDADNLRISDPVDQTKLLVFDNSGQTTGTTRTITVPDADITLPSAFAASESTAAKTSAYTVVAGDDQATIKCDTSSAAFTVTLLAAATAGDGFTVTITKTTSDGNALTIDGNSSETINGATTFVLYGQYESVTLICDGSNWVVKSSAISAVVNLGSGTFSGDTNLTITDISDAWIKLELVLLGCQPASNNVRAYGKISADNFSTSVSFYDSTGRFSSDNGAATYGQGLNNGGSGVVGPYSTDLIGNGEGQAFSATITLYDFATSGRQSRVRSEFVYQEDNSRITEGVMAMNPNVTEAHNAFRFSFTNTGGTNINIAQGEWALYGYRK